MKLETREVKKSGMFHYAMLCYEGSALLSIKMNPTKTLKTW